MHPRKFRYPIVYDHIYPMGILEENVEIISGVYNFGSIYSTYGILTSETSLKRFWILRHVQYVWLYYGTGTRFDIEWSTSRHVTCINFLLYQKKLI